MNFETADREQALVRQAAAGDGAALEELLTGVRDMVFSLSLRMLGQVADAEDAAQDIFIKVIEHLPGFRQQSSFSTWVFAIALNYLRSYKKGMFAQRPLSFEVYGEDIASGRERDVPDMTAGVERDLLARELKLSCTNVMLQCLDPESRGIYILGTMFRVDSQIAGQILGMTPEAYRQRLSRIRKKVSGFLAQYCGLSGTGTCSCSRRVDYAIATGRIDPHCRSFEALAVCPDETVQAVTDAMEDLDELSMIFARMPRYRAPEKTVQWLKTMMASRSFDRVLRNGGKPDEV